MGDCGCGGGGGGATTTVASHSQARAGQRASCQADECDCDSCVRLRIVKFLPWLSAPDIAVGAHIPGGAMVVPELPEREPDTTPPWMWIWWEDGGGTGYSAPESRDATAVSSQKVQDKDTGEISGPTGSANDGDDEETDDGPKPGEALEYWEDKKHHLDDQFATPKSSAPSGDEAPGDNNRPAEGPCWPLPWSVDMWNTPILSAICEIDFGPSEWYNTNGATIHGYVPADYVPTRSKKEMREYCIPEWEDPRAISWSALARMVSVGIHEDRPGLYWSESGGFVKRALMNALATMHTFADLVDDPAVFSTPCKLDSDQLRDDIENAAFQVRMDELEPGAQWAELFGPTNVSGTITINTGSAKNNQYASPTILGATLGGAPVRTVSTNGLVSIEVTDSGSRRAYTLLGTVRMSHHKVMNAALADYYFWWAWRLYSYAMDYNKDDLLIVAKIAAKAAVSEICEIAELLVHEYSHVSGGSFEDYEPIEGRCVNCCHYMASWVFLQRALATLALPFPMYWATTVTGSSDVVSSSPMHNPSGRFDLVGWGWSISEARSTSSDSCDYTVTATHASFWTLEHEVSVTWSIPGRSCWDSSSHQYSSDSATFAGQGAGTNR